MKIGNLVKVLHVDRPEEGGRNYQNQIGVIMDLAGEGLTWGAQFVSDRWDVQVCLVAGETRWFKAESLTELPREEGLQLARQEWAATEPENDAQLRAYVQFALCGIKID